MAQAVGNKAKGRQHSHDAPRRKVMRELRARRQRDRKRKRDAKVLAAKTAGRPYKPSPSDQRRAAARKLGYISARKRIPRRSAIERVTTLTKAAVVVAS